MITRVAENKHVTYKFVPVSQNEIHVLLEVRVTNRLVLQSEFPVGPCCEGDRTLLQVLARILYLQSTNHGRESIVAALDGWLLANKHHHYEKDAKVPWRSEDDPDPQWQEYKRRLQERQRFMSGLHDDDKQLRELPAFSSALEAFENTETMKALRILLASGPVSFYSRENSEQRYLFYQGSVWRSRKLLSNDDWVLLIEQKLRKEEQMLQFLSSESSSHQASGHERKTIPPRVRIDVWRRDNGKCARCGSLQNLEFDHIVPVSKGGSDTARNVELLCQSCNRMKRDSIA